MNAPLIIPAESFEIAKTDVKELTEILKGFSLVNIVGGVSPPGYPDRFGHYQYTGNGRIFFSCDPRADEVHIDDIALHLSRLPRFGGATEMSVAEHCWHCSHVVPEEVALEALLHDAAEAYIGDLIRPLKYLPIFGDLYLKIERGIELVVAERFELVYPWPAEVKKADEYVVGIEVARNIKSKVVNHLSDNVEAREMGQTSERPLYNWPRQLAELYFMQRFLQLASKRGVIGR